MNCTWYERLTQICLEVFVLCLCHLKVKGKVSDEKTLLMMALFVKTKVVSW